MALNSLQLLKSLKGYTSLSFKMLAISVNITHHWSFRTHFPYITKSCPQSFSLLIVASIDSLFFAFVAMTYFSPVIYTITKRNLKYSPATQNTNYHLSDLHFAREDLKTLIVLKKQTIPFDFFNNKRLYILCVYHALLLLTLRILRWM